MRYRKKPVVIEAMQFGGDDIESLLNWLTDNRVSYNFESDNGGRSAQLTIATPEGVDVMHVSYGDYVIKGIKGEFYPCKPDIFHETYEETS